jgi:hypothetical protein
MHTVKTGYGQLKAPIRIASMVLTEMTGSRPAMTLSNELARPDRKALYRNTLRFLSSSTFASSTIVRRATFHPPSTFRSTSSRHPDSN